MTAALSVVPPVVARPRPARRLLTFGQVRLRLGISRRTLYDWLAQDKFPKHSHSLPEIRSLTQRRRWDERLVLDWIEARRVGREVSS